MQILFTCIPQTGHLFPLLPLAEAFAADGHDVLFAAGADAADAVQARGLSFRETGPPFVDWFGALAARTRGLPGDGLPPDRVERYFLPRLFGEVGTALFVDDLLKAATERRPDLLVFDPVMYAAPLVATKLGIPAVQHTVGLLTDSLTLELVEDAVSPIWREFGYQVPAAAGMFDGVTVAVCPPSLDPPATERPRVVSMRPTQLPREDVPPMPAEFAEPGRPLVYLTLGTFSNNPDVFQLVLDALADEPVNVLVTVGRDNMPSRLKADARLVHIAQFVPQADVLPRCAMAVHHAGAGTAFGVLAHGLPSVALPQSADNFAIADRLAVAGAARLVPPAEATRETVRDAVRTVLADNAYRDASRRLANEIAAMPPPEDAARSLAAYVGGKGGG